MLPSHVLITGAAGNLGSKLARDLAGRCQLTLIDRVAAPGVHVADLACWDVSWAAWFRGVEAVVHLAGDPVAYHDWPELVGPNIDAVLNTFEAAARGGVRRVIFASSNHVMGGYRDIPDIPITEELPPKPGLRSYRSEGVDRSSVAYGATKLFGERVGRHYAECRGMEVIALRIGWVWRGRNEPGALPPDREEWFREMWLSDRDYLQLMERCLAAPLPERFLVVNGMSANSGMRWGLTVARDILGYQPQDDVRAS